MLVKYKKKYGCKYNGFTHKEPDMGMGALFQGKSPRLYVLWLQLYYAESLHHKDVSLSLYS